MGRGPAARESWGGWARLDPAALPEHVQDLGDGRLPWRDALRRAVLLW